MKVPRQRVLFVFETAWDRRQLEICRPAWSERHDCVFAGPSDGACAWDFDTLAFIDEMVRRQRGRIQGVASSSDYPGAAAAAAIATGLGLPGSRPERIMRCSHKYYSRLAQKDAVPGATPRFCLIDPGLEALPEIGFPCFLKPVKGAFSIMARRIDDAAAFAAFRADPAVNEYRRYFVDIYNRMAAAYTDFTIDGSHFIAEEVLRGAQATVEGVVLEEEIRILGVVDSILHPGTGSFIRFDYPSCLPDQVQRRMVAIACRAMRAAGLAWSFFNIEMVYSEAMDRVSIVEINPRICGQFADLYQKVDGINSYEMLLDLATGRAPERRRRRGEFQAASSYPLRIFEPALLETVPGPAEVAAAEALYPGTMVWVEAEAGQPLADFKTAEDGSSYRYGLVHVGAGSREECGARFEAVRDRLGFRFSPLPG